MCISSSQQAIAAAGSLPPDKNLSPKQQDVIKCCCLEPAPDSGETKIILSSIASSQHFLEGQNFGTLSLKPEIITFLKQTLDSAYDNICLLDAVRMDIGHVREDFHDHFMASCSTMTRPRSKQPS